MSLWRQLTRGWRVLAHRRDADKDLSDEVQDYLDRATAAHEARGLSQDDARRTAMIEVGNTTVLRERVRDHGWETLVFTVIGDLRYAARRLRRSPGFTTITVITLAVGIGATTAIFSALDPVVFAPLPYPHAGRLASLVEMHLDGSRSGGTFAMYRNFLDRARSFDAVAVFKPWQPTMTGADVAERLEGQRVTAEFFQVLGAKPVAGRDFTPDDDRFQGPNVVILSDALWRRRFAADRGIVGREIKLDDDSYLVLGVMPADFENVLAPNAQLWAPLQYDPSLPMNGREWGHHLTTIGRLRPNVPFDRATAEVNSLGRSLVRQLKPETYDPNVQFAAVSMQGELTRGVKPALLAILGAVLLVLVIACVNVTNLLLARGVQRKSEFALRAALGAARDRLVRQLLTESLLLAALGGVAGIIVAALGIRALVALSPAELPRLSAIHLDAVVFLFGLAITTLIGLAFGLIPAVQASRSDPQRDLQEGNRRTVGGHHRVSGALVVAEIALAFMLLVSSGLLLRSIVRLLSVPVGFDASHVLTMQVQESGRRFQQDTARARFFARALDAVRQVPGVAAAAFTTQLPLSGDLDQYGASFEATATHPAGKYGAFRYAVSPGYIETMGIPLVSGRLLTDADRAGAPLVAVISQSLARERFGRESPIGQRMRAGGAATAPPYTIVGVVGDVKQQSLALGECDAFYVNATQWRWVDQLVSLVVRTHGDPASLAPAVRTAVWSIDKDQPVVRVSTMDHLLAASEAQRRFALILFEAFALAALVLAAAGIYGVLSGSVAERTREIGVRSALGASRESILTLIYAQGLRLTALGVLLGLVGAAAATRAIAAMLFGISRFDPATYVGVIAMLGAVVAVACGIPAWRAARVDPVITLRAE